MTDPFETLRTLADSDADPLDEVDPRFHAELVAEVRRRLDPGVPIVRGDELLVGPDQPRQRRIAPLLLAAACLALVVGGVVALTIVGQSDRPDPAVSVPVLTDVEIVQASLLDGSELGLQEVEPIFGWELRDEQPPDLFVLSRYAALPECSVFDASLRPLTSSTYMLRLFGRPPSEPVTQAVVVLPDERDAELVIDTWADPAFAACLPLYAFDFAFSNGAPAAPPFAVSADDIVYFTYEQPTGQINAAALVRVGRILQFVSASISWYEPPRPLMTEQQFGLIVERAVARTRAALAGNPTDHEPYRRDPGATQPVIVSPSDNA